VKLHADNTDDGTLSNVYFLYSHMIVLIEIGTHGIISNTIIIKSNPNFSHLSLFSSRIHKIFANIIISSLTTTA